MSRTHHPYGVQPRTVSALRQQAGGALQVVGVPDEVAARPVLSRPCAQRAGLPTT